MVNRFDYNTIDLIKDKIIDKIFILYSVVSLPLLLLSVYRSYLTGWVPIYMVQIVFLTTFWILYFFRKKFSFKIKAGYAAFTVLILAITGIHYIGLLSSGIILFMLFTAFTALFLGRKYGLIALGVIFFVFVLYAILYWEGILEYKFDVLQLIVKKHVWISILTTLIVSSYTIVFIINKLESAYQSLLKESQKNEADYRLLFDMSNEGIVISDLKGNIFLVNEQFRELSKFTDEEILGKNLSQFLLPDDRENNPIKFRELANGITVHSERKVIDKFGDIRYLDIRASLLPDGRLQSFLRDITERKKIQQEFENERAFGKNLIEAMHGVFYVFENYEKLVQWNDSLLRISGYSQEELEKIHPNDLFESGNYESVKDGISESEKDGSAYFKADLVTKNGKRIPLYNSAINYEQEGKIYLMGMGYDISDLVQTEKALKISEENFRNIYNNTSDAIFIFNYNFEILSVNDTFFSLTGLDKEDISSINIFDFIFDHNALSKVAGDVNKLDEDRVVVAEYFIEHKNGRKFPVEVRSSRINYEGKPAVVTAFNDISARKSLERQVYTGSLKAEEDERGRIAKDLHDGLGPLLSTCKIYLHNIKNAEFTAKEEKSFGKLSELINESLIGVKEISNNLSPHILRNFGLVHALKSFMEKLSAYTEMKIEYFFDASGRYDEVVEITLYRVVTELFNNTLKYSKAKNVSVRLVESGKRLKLSYVEDGIGFNFDEMIQKKSGLGLFNIKSRINSIGGILIFKSSIGKGVSVEIETNKKKMVRIAIVEDHTLFRDGLKSLLEHNDDYKVVAEFANGKEFVDSLFDIDVDLVLIDIEMPIMNGIEATQIAKMKLPKLRFIALSMYSDQKYYYEMIKAGASGFVLKEATTDELGKAIEDVMSDHSYFSPKLLQQVVLHIPEIEDKQKMIHKLQITEREFDVLGLICQGLTNNEISDKLFLSPKTIETHKTRLLKKTSTKNSTSLIVFALKNKLVEL